MASKGLMGFLVVGFCYILFSLETMHAATFDVTSYGAKGDGSTDDSKAFLQAWDDLCKDSNEPTLIIPSNMIFLLSPVIFDGSLCKSENTYIKLLGTITAPKTLEGWTNCYRRQYWIYFTSVRGLAIDGPGTIDGQGAFWWTQTKTTETCDRPTALHFNLCPGLRLTGTTHMNSPFLHISITNSHDVDIGNLQITAPEDSPNTDGINISVSSHIKIHDSNIQTGDDCVAINGGVIDMNITNVFCGPGHGISIGSLGENEGYDTVEQVRVENCNITGTTNGLRIKTVPNGTGYAKGILFQDNTLVNVKNPIIINQYYCPHSVCPASTQAVQVSDVTYMNIQGSSSTKFAITFNCSEIHGCKNIVTKDVHITGGLAYIRNAQGTFVDTTPPIDSD